METLSVVSTPDNEQKLPKPNKSTLKKRKHTIGGQSDFSPFAPLQSPHGKACTLSGPAAATFVPDLNSGGNPLASAEAVTLIPAKETPRTMMLNFQCSNYGISETGFRNADLFTNVTSIEKKKRGRKRKNAHAIPQAQRRKKEELPNGLTRGITILLLKFSSQVSMPSRDDLTSTFSAFGPLDASETHVSEELISARVAFVSSGDAIEAVKSLEKANPFGKTLVSFRLQQKLISVQRNKLMPVISQASPLPTPTSVDSMKQNLLMMTAMLEKSGDRLSRETKAKLKSEVTELLVKVSSMPSSSSSS